MTDYEPPSLKTTLIATGIALIVAIIVLLVAILPAEYGIDPTGIGGAMGLTDLAGAEAEPDGLDVTITDAATFYQYNVTWESTQRLAQEDDGELAVGDETTITYSHAANNLTRLTAVLSWDDDEIAGQQSDPDTFDVTITSPAGDSRSWTGRNDGPSATLEMPYIAREVPAMASLEATSDADARAAILARHPVDTTSIGDWTIAIRMREAGGVGPISDDGNAWSLRVFTTTYEAQLGAGEATGERSDDLTITIPAGDGVEYKVFAVEGAQFDYTWSAPIDLFYDFHGVRGSGEETSHETGTDNERDGTLIVPFNGRHGWYWQNDSLQDVQVTLTLAGTYEIVPQ